MLTLSHITYKKCIISLGLKQNQTSNKNIIFKKNQKTLKTILQIRKIKVALCSGCESIDNYKKLNKIHQGTYGVVYRAINVLSGQVYAVKKLKIEEGCDFPITSLRQISILRTLDHQNIVKIVRVAGSSKQDKVYIIMEYLEHELKELLAIVTFKENQIKTLIKDLLEGLAYLHDRKIVHRDLKTSNLLYSNSGILKICDFGLARKASRAAMTQKVATLWYRPPELLLGVSNYSTQLDIWSAGCIMAELAERKPLFQGETEAQQLDLIIRATGAPSPDNWPELKTLKNYHCIQGKKLNGKLSQMVRLSEEGIDLLKLLLNPNPKGRITAKKALSHAWFKQGVCNRDEMPSYTPLNERERTRKKIKSDE